MTTAWSPDLYQRAYEFAAELHNEQRVPGSSLPYITHVSLVSMELLAAASDCDDIDFAMQCALLHDVLEDTPATYADVASRFGANIATAVQALTKNRELPKGEQLTDSLDRVRRQPRDVWMVKLADRITNLRRPPSTWSSEKKARYRDDAIRIRQTLEGASPLLLSRIDLKIAEYAAYI